MYCAEFLYNGTEVVGAVSRPGVYGVLEYRIHMSAAPWLGHVVRRGVPIELSMRPLLALETLLVASSVFVAQSGWFYWYFTAVAPFFHLFTRRVYVVLQLIFIALLYLAPPMLSWVLGPFKSW